MISLSQWRAENIARDVVYRHQAIGALDGRAGSPGRDVVVGELRTEPLLEMRPVPLPVVAACGLVVETIATDGQGARGFAIIIEWPDELQK